MTRASYIFIDFVPLQRYQPLLIPRQPKDDWWHLAELQQIQRCVSNQAIWSVFPASNVPEKSRKHTPPLGCGECLGSTASHNQRLFSNKRLWWLFTGISTEDDYWVIKLFHTFLIFSEAEVPAFSLGMALTMSGTASQQKFMSKVYKGLHKCSLLCPNNQVPLRLLSS